MISDKTGHIVTASKINKNTLEFFLKTIYNSVQSANVAQSVEQLIRNQQVTCSSHAISSKKSGSVHWTGPDFCFPPILRALLLFYPLESLQNHFFYSITLFAKKSSKLATMDKNINNATKAGVLISS